MFNFSTDALLSVNLHLIDSVLLLYISVVSYAI